MKMNRDIRGIIRRPLDALAALLVALALVMAVAAPAPAAEMKDYCIVPPYVKSGLKPNILIFMDNSEKNGGAAYTQEGDPSILNDPMTGAMLYNSATSEAAGLFRENLWYKYDGKLFVPANPATNPTAVFEGNLLNWMTTSMYDIITSVIVGGKSTSRQENAHTLSSYATGNWNPKAYIYREHPDYGCGVRACMFKVVTTDAAGAKLVISDIKEYIDLDSSYTCGLIGANPKPPAPEYTNIGDTSAGTCDMDLPSISSLMNPAPSPDIPGATEEAALFEEPAHEDAPANAGESVILGMLYRAINGLMGLIAEPAEAGPVKVSDPFKDNLSFKVLMYEPYKYDPGASGGSGYYEWSLDAATPLPSGLIFNSTTGQISGLADDFSQLGQHTINITVYDALDLTKSADRTLILELTGVALSVAQPYEGTKMHDAIWFEDYTGYQPIAIGGAGGYTWSIISGSLPPGLSMDDTGLISGYHEPDKTKGYGYYNFQLEVSDGYSTAVSNSYIYSHGAVFQKLPLPFGNQPPDAIMGEEYQGFKPGATGGTGDYTWFATLPAGLTIDSKTGQISGTPEVQAEGTFAAKVSVFDDRQCEYVVDRWICTHKGGLFWDFSIEVVRPEWLDVKITWPGLPWLGDTVPDPDQLDPGLSDPDLLEGENFWMGSVYNGASYPLSEGGFQEAGWTRVYAQGGIDGYDTAHLFMQAGIWNTEVIGMSQPRGLSEMGMAIDPASGIIYTPVGNPYRSVSFPGFPQELKDLPDGLFPGFVNAPPLAPGDVYTNQFTVSVTDGSGADFIYMKMMLLSEFYDYTVDSSLNGRIECDPLNWESTRCKEAIWPEKAWKILYPGFTGRQYSGAGISTDGGYGRTHCEVLGTGYVKPGDYRGLPPGLTMNPYNCTISGTVEEGAEGTYWITAWVRNEFAKYDSLYSPNWNTYGNKVTMLMNVYDPSPLSFRIPKADGQSLTQATAERYYEFQPVVVGGTPFNTTGTPQYDWVIGPLPEGLTYNDKTGFINGTPKKYGNYTFKLTATDLKGRSASLDVQLGVLLYYKANFVNISLHDYLPEGTVGQPYQGFTVVGGGGLGGAYKFYAKNALSPLPSGLTIDENTGLISGTPGTGTSGTWEVHISVEDAFKDTLGYTKASTYVYITINEEPASVYSEDFLTDICNGDYVDNCNGGETPSKHGLLQDYWDFANFGLLDFKDPGGSMIPEVATCMPPNNQASFFTDVQNALPTGSLTDLINGEYIGVQYFMNLERNPAGQTCATDMFPVDTTSCQKNYVLMLTSGEGAEHPETNPLLFTDTSHTDEGLTVPEECKGLTYDLSKNACFGAAQDIRPDDAGTGLGKKGEQRVNTYIVHTMGINDHILKETANASDGQYYYASNAKQVKEKLESALKDMIKKASAGTAASVLASGEGSGANIVQAIFYPKRRFYNSQDKTYDEIGWIGKLSAFWYYADPYFGLSDIREETDIGSVPPTLNLLDDLIIRPFYNYNTATVDAFRWQDSDGDGRGDVFHSTLDFDNIGAIWEAGKLLWQRDLDTHPRKIFVNVRDQGGAAMSLFDKTTVASDSLLREYMQTPAVVNAVAIANFINGYDDPNLRSRMVRVDLNNDGDTLDTGETEKRVWKLGDVLNSTPRLTPAGIPLNKYHQDYCDFTYYDKSGFVPSYVNSEAYSRRGMAYTGGNDGMLHAFKLGYLDQERSGATISALNRSWDPANKNNPADLPMGYEKWAFIPKNALPYLKYQSAENYCHVFTVDQPVTIFDASLCESTYDPDTNVEGNTENAFSCTYSNDGLKQWDSWRTILVGGMRYGGGCKPANASCTVDTNGDGTVDDEDCVKAPLKASNGEDIGYSSYFALDITKEDEPVFMWEYTHPELGHSTSGPAVLRFDGADGSALTLGHWYLVFGSGPTGPIDKVSEQYLGTSDQSLKLFVIDLKTGEKPLGTSMANDYLEPQGGMDQAFVHTMGYAMADFGRMDPTLCDNNARGNYNTDSMFIGYIKKCDGTPLQNVHPTTFEYVDNAALGLINSSEPCPEGTWRNGGVLRVLTHESPDPGVWDISPLIDNIGPVYSAPDKAWYLGDSTHPSQVKVVVGTGRYFYEREDPLIIDPKYAGKGIADDSATVRQIIAVEDPCVDSGSREGPYLSALAEGCTTPADYPSHEIRYDASGTIFGPWVWTLDPQNEQEQMYDGLNREVIDPGTGQSLKLAVGAERVTTNVKVVVATKTVYVTTFKPFKDQCSLGGVTHVYAIDLETGGSKTRNQGIAIMQLSTGNIKKVDLSKDFQQMGGRRTTGEVGITAVEAPLIPELPKGVPRIMHMFQRPQ